MLHTPVIPIYESGERVVGVPTKMMKRWTGPWDVSGMISDNEVEIKVKGRNTRLM